MNLVFSDKLMSVCSISFSARQVRPWLLLPPLRAGGVPRFPSVCINSSACFYILSFGRYCCAASSHSFTLGRSVYPSDPFQG